MNSSSYTISNLRRITNSELSQQILKAPITADGPLAIVDVRDSDYIGGHIRGCINTPSTSLDWKMPELVRQLKEKETVVFHCALSQQRGPSAALSYLRERDRLVPSNKENGNEDQEQKQQVYVLDGGFVKWQEKYGEDERLTEGYQKDVWEFGY
jgi:rhodanese-related sulfurtransferase